MHFVVAVDASECSERALLKAISLMKDKKTDKLTLVHAMELGKVLDRLWCSEHVLVLYPA